MSPQGLLTLNDLANIFQNILKSVENNGLHQIHRLDIECADLDKIYQLKSKNLPEETQSKLRNELFGAGPLEELLCNENVTEILINDWDNIWIEKNGMLQKHQEPFLSLMSFRHFLNRIYFDINSEPTISQPFLNANWRGFRLHIGLENVCSSKTHVSLRRISNSNWSLAQLVKYKWAEQTQVEFLKKIYLIERKNILIVGPTGTGKTTVLSALLAEIEEADRTIIIEDTDEIRIPNSSSLKLLTNTFSANFPQNFNIADLIKESLRMRPNRIVVGEIRSEEAKDLILALSTGHSGGLCTLHAATAREALLRLEMLVQLGAPNWTTDSIRRLLSLALHYIVVVEKKESGERKLKSIHELGTNEINGITMEPIYENT